MKVIITILFMLATVTLFAQWTPNGNNIYNSNSGNVGIGTATPQARLDVRGGVSFSEGRLYQSGDIPNDNSAQFYNNSVTGYGLYSQGGGSGRYAFNFLNQGGTSILYGRGDGNVGIGTANPIAKLDVQGNSNFSGGRLTQQGDMPNDNNAVFVNSSTSGYGIYSKGGLGTRYAFHFENQYGTSILYGQGDGNIGIGTTAPDAKLTVKGTIHANEVKVDLAVPGPDYVFNSDYNLLTLEEIKTYIDKNKHLPEVPSAKEMEANGVQLGEMNMLLLKKIEELTLYQIQSIERIQKLENEINVLKKK